MAVTKITNLEFGKMVRAAADKLGKNAEFINSLNVFPVPDGAGGPGAAPLPDHLHPGLLRCTVQGRLPAGRPYLREARAQVFPCINLQSTIVCAGRAGGFRID